MTSVLDRSALEQSPLADLHLIANEVGVDGFRRLRKADLIDAIVAKQEGDEAPAAAAEVPAAAVAADEEEAPKRGLRGRRGGRGRSRDADEEEGATDEGAGEDRTVEGVVELLPNGSGFVRLSHPDHTDDDAYISAAQVKRCELVTGDRVG